MGNRSKAARAHLNNLPKAPVKSYKATVEDWGDSNCLGYALDSKDGMWCVQIFHPFVCKSVDLHGDRNADSSDKLFSLLLAPIETPQLGCSFTL